MSAKTDDVTLWQERIEALEGKIVDAEQQVEDTVAEASRLLAEQASPAKVERAKTNADAARADLDHLIRALSDARAELAKAEARQAEQAAQARADRLAALQKKRTKVLREAQERFDAGLAKIQEAEALSIEMHTLCAGAHRAQEAINSRHAGLLQWLVIRLCAALPIAEGFLGAIAGNLNAVRGRIGDADLVGTQVDVHAEFVRDQTERQAA